MIYYFNNGMDYNNTIFFLKNIKISTNFYEVDFENLYFKVLLFDLSFSKVDDLIT